VKKGEGKRGGGGRKLNFRGDEGDGGEEFALHDVVNYSRASSVGTFLSVLVGGWGRATVTGRGESIDSSSWYSVLVIPVLFVDGLQENFGGKEERGGGGGGVVRGAKLPRKQAEYRPAKNPSSYIFYQCSPSGQRRRRGEKGGGTIPEGPVDRTFSDE